MPVAWEHGRRSQGGRGARERAVDADRSPDRQPWFIQHRAGNHRAAWRRAVASPADYLEVDVWLQGDRIASHHDPLMHDRLPFLTRRHQLPRLRLPGRARWLEQARAPGRIFLDIKDTRAAAIPAILAALAASGSRPGATASTPIWSQLDALADRAPDIGRFYTLRPQRDADPGGTDGAWTAYLRRADAGQGGAGVSLHRRLATPRTPAHPAATAACARSATRSTTLTRGCACWTWAREGLRRIGPI